MDVTSAPLVFGSIPLARRIEAAEVRLMRAFGEAAVSLAHPGTLVEPFAGGLAVSGGPASPISKVLATGFAGVPSDAEFDERVGGRLQRSLAPPSLVPSSLSPFSFRLSLD